MPDLDGKIVAIAGAGGGLGPTVCARLAEAGATLALTDVDQGRLDELAADLELPAERLDARPVDLLSPDAAGEWAAGLAERFGRIDALLHLVGGWKGGEPLATAPLADMKIQLAEPQRINGGAGYEIRAQATAVRGDPVSLVQWVRFGGNGFLRIIGVTARPNWDAMFTRFRAVRDGVEFR